MLWLGGVALSKRQPFHMLCESRQHSLTQLRKATGDPIVGGCTLPIWAMEKRLSD